MAEERDGPGMLLSERWVPVPRSISPEAQAFLANVPMAEAKPFPALDDVAGWKAHIAASNERTLGITRRNRAMFPSTVTTHHLSAAPLYEVVPDNADAGNAARAMLYIHGGGFVMGAGEAAELSAMPFAHGGRMSVWSLDYRMAPDHPFPAAIDDAVEAWRFLLDRHDPASLALVGPSAGGNIAVALVLRLRELGLPLPAVLAVHSPAADLTDVGDTLITNVMLDCILQRPFPELGLLYAGGHDLADPLLSPIHADFSGGFPPTILTSGTRDLLLSPTVLLHRALRRGGVDAHLHVWEAMTHAPFFGSPEEREVLAETIGFIVRHLA